MRSATVPVWTGSINSKPSFLLLIYPQCTPDSPGVQGLRAKAPGCSREQNKVSSRRLDA